jgi:TonB family protein
MACRDRWEGRFGRTRLPRLPAHHHLTVTRLWLVALIGYAATWAVPAVASPSNNPAPPSRITPIPFNIPAQPLESALDAYGKISSEQVLYETSLTAGLRSTSVQGVFTPEAALSTLLTGTGLVARYTTMDAYTLMRAPAPPSPGAPSIDADLVKYGPYLGAVQASILKAICETDGARPGAYQATLQFWIDPSGEITDVEVLTTTGDPDRDADILGALQNVTVGEGPPAGMPQPLTMAISPKSPNITGDCADADAAGGGPP